MREEENTYLEAIGFQSSLDNDIVRPTNMLIHLF
jgi:hypothetical protein